MSGSSVESRIPEADFCLRQAAAEVLDEIEHLEAAGGRSLEEVKRMLVQAYRKQQHLCSRFAESNFSG